MISAGLKALAAMVDFEGLVLSQKPAATAWEPVTDYSLEGRRAIEEPHARLVKEVFHATEIYDAGCGAQAVFVRLLNEVGAASSHACGFDVAIDNDHRPDPNAFHGDLTGWPLGDLYEQHDLVICREVLEHLTIRQIRRAVIVLCAISSRFVYVTTRFSSEHDLLRVETHDDLDPTHITIPSKDLLRLLFVLEGFKRRPDLEAAMDWMKKDRVLVYERAA